VTKRVLGVLGLIVFGLVIGVVGAFVQAQRALLDTAWGSIAIPWGVPLGATACSGDRAGTWALTMGRLGRTPAKLKRVVYADHPQVTCVVGGTPDDLLGGVILGSAAATLHCRAEPRTRSGDGHEVDTGAALPSMRRRGPRAGQRERGRTSGRHPHR
jgi:hypothetical protein